MSDGKKKKSKSFALILNINEINHKPYYEN